MLNKAVQVCIIPNITTVLPNEHAHNPIQTIIMTIIALSLYNINREIVFHSTCGWVCVGDYDQLVVLGSKIIHTFCVMGFIGFSDKTIDPKIIIENHFKENFAWLFGNIMVDKI